MTLSLDILLDERPIGLADGIHNLDAATYHADLIGPEPSLSASIAAELCNRSPLHAWTKHPRLNPAYARTDTAPFDLGTTVHALLLNGDDVCTVVDAPDWRTKHAREARNEARANGKVPLLIGQWANAQAMVTAIREQLPTFDADPPLLANGWPERTLVWREGDVTCRARVDWLHDTYLAIDDVKTTGASANPRDWSRRMWDHGSDVQYAFYRRAVKVLTGTEPHFRFLVAETAPPYACSVVDLAPSAMCLAEEKVEWAIKTWRECLERDEWPSYPRRVSSVPAAPWEMERWLEARAAEEDG